MHQTSKLNSQNFYLISSENLQSAQTLAALQTVQYKCQIKNNILNIHLSQTFVSQSDSEYSEKIYYFPIQEGVCLELFEARYNEKTIKGIVKNKDEAKSEYQENKNQGNFVSFAEKTSSNDQEYCKIKLGNLPNGQQVEVKIIFSQQLNSYLNKYFVAHIPLIHCKGEVATKLGKNLLTLDLNCTGKILYAESKGYPAEKIMLDDNTVKFNLKQTLLQNDKDYYQLIFSFEGMFNPQVIFGSSKIFNEDSVKNAILPVSYSAMVSFIPNFNEDITQEIDDSVRAAINNGDDIFSDEYQQKINQELIDHLNCSRSEFIFLLDRSGSMSGESISRACEALILFLRSLPNDSYFNVVSFGSSFDKLFPSSAQYSRYNKQIFLLTDGQVDSRQQVISLIKQNNKNSRIHSIGFGSEADKDLIKKSAISGKGFSKIVDKNCDLSEAIINILSLCITPTFDEFKITYDENIFDSTYFPCVFKDEVINIHFFFKPLLEFQSLTEQQKKIGIEYYDSQKKQKVYKEVRLEMQDSFSSNKELQESVFKIGKQLYLNENIIDEEVNSQLIQQAIDYQLLTQKTALICVIETLNDQQKIVYQNINNNKQLQSTELKNSEQSEIIPIYDMSYSDYACSPQQSCMYSPQTGCYSPVVPSPKYSSPNKSNNQQSEIIQTENNASKQKLPKLEQQDCVLSNHNLSATYSPQAGCNSPVVPSPKYSSPSKLQNNSFLQLSEIKSTYSFDKIDQQSEILQIEKNASNQKLPKLENLLNLVNSQGIWQFDENLVIEMSLIDKDTIKQFCSQFNSNDTFMTIFMITILEINYCLQKSKWKLIFKKSLTYVKSQLNQGQDLNSIKQNIKQLINNSSFYIFHNYWAQNQTKKFIVQLFTVIEMCNKAKSLWSISEQVILKYNQFSEKEILKRIITTQNDDFNKQNELFKEIIVKAYNKQKDYKQSLQDTINKFQTQRDMINFNTANQTVRIYNFEGIKIKTNEEELDYFFENMDQVKTNNMTTSQLIVKLLSNKLNYCSEELTCKLKEILKQLSVAIDNHSVKDYINADLFKVGSHQLDDNQVDLIKTFSEQVKYDLGIYILAGQYFLTSANNFYENQANLASQGLASSATKQQQVSTRLKQNDNRRKF
ncbi:hypothetical protein ABPG72_015913 [Tetrahymena utriculariae]